MLNVIGTTEELIISPSDACQFLGLIDTADEYELLKLLIETATEEIEDVTNRRFVPQNYELKVPTLPKYLPKQPTISIESIEYMINGVYQIVPSEDYFIYEDLGLSCIDSGNISLAHDINKFAVKIKFRAGYEAVPKSIKTWVSVRVATLYEHREEFVVGTIVGRPQHVESIVQRYKIRSL